MEVGTFGTVNTVSALFFSERDHYFLHKKLAFYTHESAGTSDHGRSQFTEIVMMCPM